MNSREIRYKFFDFFIKRGHTKVSSSSLIPADDPTLLFANAGMNQFKDVFLGKEKRSYTRAVSIQKCIRAGGKHNDLENVGFTQRHLTFFEMMGNFSFGDYFKKDAIRFAWDFLTQEAMLPADKLYASVYKDDQEAYDIWQKEIGLPQNRIIKLGEADNFWQMGDTGPCGPCTEIYIDRGSVYGCDSQKCGPGCSCDRFMEIWNNVFMQFDRQIDGSLKPLNQTGVDTGMGLERLCVAIQKKDSIFDTDIFEPLIKRIEQLTGISYTSSPHNLQAACRVLCDHVRSSSFAIADGALPANEGRGYVLRKIIRRAALFMQKLTDKNIFPDLAQTLIEQMQEFYPELKERQAVIISTLTIEIDKFTHNLIMGQDILQKYLKESAASKIITGSQAFKLYDTYGFPLELTKVIAQETGYSVDVQGFEHEMEGQRLQSGKKHTSHELAIDNVIPTEFTGYAETRTTSIIQDIIVNNEHVIQAHSGVDCWIITQKSPLYVEGGGQVSDTAVIISGKETMSVLELKKVNKAILARVITQSGLHIGEQVTIVVDSQIRNNTMKNHTATHLLQAALMRVLGKGVKQAGSLVHPDYLRFDFSYHEAITPEQIAKIEQLVNQEIMRNIPVTTTVTTYQDAIGRGVIAFFGEKYNPESVRVVEIPSFSAELCGGTHVTRTGDIGIFKITDVSALSAGNKRIVALTGPKALELYQITYGQIKQLAQEYKVKVEQVNDAAVKQREFLKNLQAEVKQLKKHILSYRIPIWINEMDEVNNLPYLYLELRNHEPSELRIIIDELIKAQAGFYFITNEHHGRITFIAQLADSYAGTIDFKALLDWLKLQGFTGGASFTSAQGGVKVIDDGFNQSLHQWLKIHVRLS